MDTRIVAVIDDSRLARTMIAAFITGLRPIWTVHQFENGDKALAALAELPVDYATIDYNMPGIDGLTLAAQLKELRPSMRIALVTANIQGSIQQRAHSLDLRFLSKPITEDKVSALLEEWQ